MIKARTWMIPVSALVLLIIAFAAGWAAAQAFVSPEQRAAAAAPPEPADITATVDYGDLTRETTARGVIEPARTWTMAIPSLGSVTTVTSANSSTGDELHAGDSPLSVNGIPLLLLPGQFPFYRDLGLGDQGPDVEQLQVALNSLGFTLALTGEFDAATESAVEQLYTRHGREDQRTLIASMVVVVPNFPVTLLSSAAVGDTMSDGPVVRLGSGDLIMRIPVPAGLAHQISIDAPVSILKDDGTSITGRVLEISSVADTPETVEVITVLDTSEDQAVSGESAVAVITLETLAHETLIVPTAAIVSRGSTDAVVLMQSPAGPFVEVAVRELAQAEGKSAIEVPSGGLSAGDTVKVG